MSTAPRISGGRHSVSVGIAGREVRTAAGASTVLQFLFHRLAEPPGKRLRRHLNQTQPARTQATKSFIRPISSPFLSGCVITGVISLRIMSWKIFEIVFGICESANSTMR